MIHLQTNSTSFPSPTKDNGWLPGECMLTPLQSNTKGPVTVNPKLKVVSYAPPLSAWEAGLVCDYRESHCEIERRRRSKMATYVNELCDMVPACSTLARKPDKLTILRLAVAHMKSLQGRVTSTGGSVCVILLPSLDHTLTTTTILLTTTTLCASLMTDSERACLPLSLSHHRHHFPLY